MNKRFQAISSGLWQWIASPGLERYELGRNGAEWVLRGTVLTLANTAAEMRYEIVCDGAFRTQNASIAVHDAKGERTLEITTDGGRWYANGHETASVQGAVDIDLGWSPSTNTLPIRRLGLEVGQSSGEFVAAWVRFPDLTLEPLPQQYVRLAPKKYRYSSRGGEFTAELTIDEDGLVVNYEGFWERVTERD